MVRLYQYPVVDPRATIRNHLHAIEAAARESAEPMAIYPEGTRTRSGDIGPWKRTGLERILNARRWSVYLMVADGFWRAARLDDFLKNVSTVKGTAQAAGPFESPEPGQPMEAFIDAMRERMQAMLDDMRAGAAAPR
jgi:1-acyl-sn-glycerol-3-phosphate acyltransferase